jgi:hypothetical protein
VNRKTVGQTTVLLPFLGRLDHLVIERTADVAYGPLNGSKAGGSSVRWLTR